MNQEQKTTIQSLHKRYMQNKASYAGYGVKDYCSFTVLHNPKYENDPNICVIWVRISGVDTDMLPETEILNILVDVDGKEYDMSMMPMLFANSTEVITYLQQLEKMDWNGK